MEIQILPLLVTTGCLVGSGMIAARSLAVARLRAPYPRHHGHGRQHRLPPLPATAGSFARRESPAALFVFQLLGAVPTVNPPATVSLSGERGLAGDPIAARTREGAMDGAVARGADNGTRFLRTPQFRRHGLLCPGMMFSTTFRELVGRTPTDYRRLLPPDKA
jgi:hypothetical protein